LQKSKERDHDVKQKRRRAPGGEPTRHVILQDIREFVYTEASWIFCEHIRLPVPIDTANALVSTTEYWSPRLLASADCPDSFRTIN
jgi:hypothetical protein